MAVTTQIHFLVVYQEKSTTFPFPDIPINIPWCSLVLTECWLGLFLTQSLWWWGHSCWNEVSSRRRVVPESWRPNSSNIQKLQKMELGSRMAKRGGFVEPLGL